MGAVGEIDVGDGWLVDKIWIVTRDECWEDE